MAQASGPIEGLDHVLKVLDAVSLHSRGDEQQQLVDEAKIVVSKLRGVMKRSQVEQVADLVRANSWSKANEAMKCNFPRGISIGFIEEVLALVCGANNLHDLTSAIMWAGLMNAMQPRLYDAIYEQFKARGFTGRPQVLLLRSRIKCLPAAGVPDDVRAQLDAEFGSIVEQVAEGVKKKDYSLSIEINEIDAKSSYSGKRILNEVVAAVVQKFETFNLANTLLLIQYSMGLPKIENCCFLIDALLKELESRSLLDSEVALHLWSHAKQSTSRRSRASGRGCARTSRSSAPTPSTNWPSKNKTSLCITKSSSSTTTARKLTICTIKIGIYVPSCVNSCRGTTSRTT
jgi:hypothetical protein